MKTTVVCLLAFVVVSSGLSQSRRGTSKSQCTVRVSVIDAVTRKPVPKVSMVAYVTGVPGRWSRLTTTDAAGKFSVTVPKGATVLLYPSRPVAGGPLIDEEWMRRSRPTTVRVTRDVAVTVSIKTVATRDVTVQVIDADGNPAANAIVITGPSAVRTNASGRVTVKVPKAPPAVAVTALSAKHDARASVTISREDVTASIQLKPAETIQGRVLDQNGDPVPGLRLMFIPTFDGQVNMEVLTTSMTETDGEGNFKMPLFPSAEYQVYWERQGEIKMGQGRLLVGADGRVEPIRVERVPLDPAIFAGSVCRSEATKCLRISSFALDAEDKILVCDEEGRRVLKVSRDDELLRKWELDFPPEAIESRADGTIIVGGHGHVVVMGSDGTIQRRGKVPGARSVTAVASWQGGIFVCVGGDAGFSLYRFKDDLTEPRRVISGLSGCCGQLDFRIHDGHIYIAENTRFSISKYTLDGKKVAAYTHNDPKKPGHYGDGCCEPKNICFGPDGTIYAAASAPMEVRQYAADGKFLRLVGKLPDADGSCVRVTVGVTRDGARVYLLDTANNCIRLLPASGS